MAQGSPLHVLVEVELDRDAGGVGAADPPLRSGAAARAGKAPQLEHRLFDGMRRGDALGKPEGGEVALAQALRPDPGDGGAGPSHQRRGERAVDHAHQCL